MASGGGSVVTSAAVADIMASCPGSCASPDQSSSASSSASSSSYSHSENDPHLASLPPVFFESFACCYDHLEKEIENAEVVDTIGGGELKANHLRKGGDSIKGESMCMNNNENNNERKYTFCFMCCLSYFLFFCFDKSKSRNLSFFFCFSFIFFTFPLIFLHIMIEIRTDFPIRSIPPRYCSHFHAIDVLDEKIERYSVVVYVLIGYLFLPHPSDPLPFASSSFSPSYLPLFHERYFDADQIPFLLLFSCRERRRQLCKCA